jgi:hypothetical protein
MIHLFLFLFISPFRGSEPIVVLCCRDEAFAFCPLPFALFYTASLWISLVKWNSMSGLLVRSVFRNHSLCARYTR